MSKILYRNTVTCCVLSLALGLMAPLSNAFEDRGGGPPMMGVPLSMFTGKGEAEDDICPEGTRVVTGFLDAWAEDDYPRMYSFLDDPVQQGYSLEDAAMDFKFMEYKLYKISSVRASSDGFEYLLSYGDWKDGNKEMKKVIIGGKTLKIILQRNRSVFKESLASYF